MQLEILEMWISPGHDFKGRHGKGRLRNDVRNVESIHCVAGSGIEGDRYFDYKEDYKGQITFFSEEIAQQLADFQQLETIDRSALRRNVLISGIDLNSLIGKRFRMGETEFTGSEECKPCYWMDEAIGPGSFDWLKGNGGLRCRITRSGMLHTGKIELKLLDAN